MTDEFLRTRNSFCSYEAICAMLNLAEKGKGFSSWSSQALYWRRNEQDFPGWFLLPASSSVFVWRELLMLVEWWLGLKRENREWRRCLGRERPFSGWKCFLKKAVGLSPAVLVDWVERDTYICSNRFKLISWLKRQASGNYQRETSTVAFWSSLRFAQN